MTLAVAGTRRDAGVSVAEVNLKLIWDVISQIKVGKQGHAYVVGSQGRLIAHPDISLVLRNTDMSRLPQFRAANNATAGEELQEAHDTQGRKVLTAHAVVAPMRWLVFVEMPLGSRWRGTQPTNPERCATTAAARRRASETRCGSRPVGENRLGGTDEPGRPAPVPSER